MPLYKKKITIWNKISCSKLQLPPEPLTRELPPRDPRSLCPQLNLLNPSPPEKNSWVRHCLTVHILQGKWNPLCTEFHSCAAVFFYNFSKEESDSNLVRNIGYSLRFLIISLCSYRPRPLTSKYSQFVGHTNIRRCIILDIDRTQNETQIDPLLSLILTSC